MGLDFHGRATNRSADHCMMGSKFFCASVERKPCVRTYLITNENRGGLSASSDAVFSSARHLSETLHLSETFVGLRGLFGRAFLWMRFRSVPPPATSSTGGLLVQRKPCKKEVFR